MHHLAGRPSRWASPWQAWEWLWLCVAVGAASAGNEPASVHPSLGPWAAGDGIQLCVVGPDHRLTCGLAARHTFALDHIAPVAQLDRASAYEAGGRLFESGRARSSAYEGSETSVIRVISARVPSRMGGPQYPAPGFT